eukprot:877108-Prymnesium_polylepis.2
MSRRSPSSIDGCRQHPRSVQRCGVSAGSVLWRERRLTPAASVSAAPCSRRLLGHAGRGSRALV